MGEWADQVLRLNDLKKRWPIISFTAPRSPNGRWQAEWPEAGGHGSTIVTRYELSDLLDELEGRFPGA